MKFISTFKLGYEIKVQEILEVAGWQIPGEYPPIVVLYNTLNICIHAFLRS